MGFFRRLFGGNESPYVPTAREADAEEVREAATVDGDQLVEIEIVGEGFRQGALAQLAGPKRAEGKHEFVGVVLRCEPRNEHDANAIRVEVMGQHVGYVQRRHAELLSMPMQRHCGGALEARGMIVGGWKDRASEGHYGIRVWLTTRDTARLGVAPSKLDYTYLRRWPDPPPPGADERRLTPEANSGVQVTVTCEEHYQPAIEAAMPDDWEPELPFPLLVDLVVAERNPHTKHDTACVEVRLGDATIGYLTPKMTQRYAAMIEACAKDGVRATALASASRGPTAGQTIWQVKVVLPYAATT